MKPGDLVKTTVGSSNYGTFIGFRVFDGKYECAEVMWFNKNAPNGDRISTIQKDLIEVINESR